MYGEIINISRNIRKNYDEYYSRNDETIVGTLSLKENTIHFLILILEVVSKRPHHCHFDPALPGEKSHPSPSC
jgi:hypothetical protein